MGEGQRDALSSTIEASCSAAVAALPRDYGTLGRYVLLQVIGQGGMGVVWRAYDPVLDRKIALKLLVAPAEARGQVVAEAQAMARVQHLNVATVYDAGIHQAGEHSLAYVAMELIAGGTLKQWLENPAHSIEARLEKFLFAGAGLEAAHQAGLVHRDFKPSNVLLGEDGRVRVSDFGLALLNGQPAAAADSSGRSPIAGTPRYMSPEQLHGLAADARSDQFAFCVALYEAIFGAHPFPAASGDSAISERRAGLLEPPSPEPRSRLAARLAPIVLRGLAAEPERRWGSMRELLDALEGARRRRGRRVLLALAVAGVVALAAVVGVRAGSGPSRGCVEAAGGAGRIWAPDRQARLSAAFARLGPTGSAAWSRVRAALDDWVARWRALRLEACEADREGEGAQPSSSLGARRECLDRRLGELDAFVQALEAPDKTVARYSLRAARELTPPESCLSAAPPAAGAQPPPRAGVAEVQAQIDRASALRHLSKLEPALADADAAAAAAARLDWAPLSAEAEVEKGYALLATNSAGTATDSFYQAMWSAERVRDDALRLEATIGLFQASLQTSDYAMSARWLGTIQAIAHHLPSNAARDARIGYNEVRLALYRGHYKQCVEVGERNLALAERAAPDSQLVVKLLLDLSRCYGSIDQEDKSVAYLQRALPLSEKINGHQDQQTASVIMELGVHARRAHHYDAALADYRDVLAIREKMTGPEDPDCAGIHNNIGNVLRDEGHADEARREYERAIAIWTKAWGPDSPAIAVGLNGLGRLAMAAGQPAQAETLFRRALEIRKHKRPAGHPDITDSISNVAEALLAQHKREALPMTEEVLAAVEHDGDSTASDRAEARFWVERAKVTLGVQAAASLKAAKADCAELDTKDSHDSFQECSEWLRRAH